MVRLEMPPACGGFVPTLNGHGFMNTRVHAYMEAFIAFAKTSATPAADIGAAYGVATIPALEAGATVIAVDLDERHLEILRQRVPDHCLVRLRTIAASFPEDLLFDRGSTGAFLLSNVVHFLSPDRFQKAVQCMLYWLVAGGKVFLLAASPYLGDCRSFVPEYEARKGGGDPWPGYTTEVFKYAPSWKGAFSSVLFLDPDVLCRVFDQAGFVVEQAEFLARPDLPAKTQLDGRESVGLIARKPLQSRIVPHA
jgi:SAM-dependent methyltransferase